MKKTQFISARNLKKLKSIEKRCHFEKNIHKNKFWERILKATKAATAYTIKENDYPIAYKIAMDQLYGEGVKVFMDPIKNAAKGA